MDNPDPDKDETGQKQRSLASTADGLKLIKAFLKIEEPADRDRLYKIAEGLGRGSVNADSKRT
jgi:hypothetical protein